LGLAAGVRLGPLVPAAAPSSTLTWPRLSTVEGEHTRAHRVPGSRDWVVERLRVGGHEEIIPVARAGWPVSGTRRGGGAARFRRAHTHAPSGRHLRAQRGWTQCLSTERGWVFGFKAFIIDGGRTLGGCAPADGRYRAVTGRISFVKCRMNIWLS